VSECDREASIMRRSWSSGVCRAMWGGGDYVGEDSVLLGYDAESVGKPIPSF